jgi:hypothetical protein
MICSRRYGGDKLTAFDIRHTTEDTGHVGPNSDALDLEQVSMLLLSLAVLLPLVELVYGSVCRSPLAQLGGVMIGYSVLALLSLVAAAIAFGTGAGKGGMLLPVTAASIVVPLALKECFTANRQRK